mmetsp:Transcript_22881/g.32782  ORF Transcript_22881/g.32782 Transcript_22881/m.32782 type:complete len:143 (+) Transcript_22881:2608-3036(+)
MLPLRAFIAMCSWCSQTSFKSLFFFNTSVTSVTATIACFLASRNTSFAITKGLLLVCAILRFSNSSQGTDQNNGNSIFNIAYEYDTDFPIFLLFCSFWHLESGRKKKKLSSATRHISLSPCHDRWATRFVPHRLAVPALLGC